MDAEKKIQQQNTTMNVERHWRSHKNIFLTLRMLRGRLTRENQDHALIATKKLSNWNT